MPTKTLQVIAVTVDPICAEQLGQNWIELKPFWQREYEAWNDKMLTGLIETMLIPEGRTMNPIWLVDHPTDNTDCTLDGMHRLTTAIDFLKNRFAIQGKYLMELDATKYDGKQFKDLDKVDKDRLKKYEFNMNHLPSVYYTDGNKRQALYYKLNRCSRPLNDFEYNRVIYHEFYNIIVEYKQDFSALFKNKKNSRGSWETELISLFALADVSSPTEYSSWSSITSFVKDWEKENLKNSETECENYIENNKNHIDDTIKLLKKIQNSLKERRFFA